MQSADRAVAIQFTWDSKADAGYIAFTPDVLGQAFRQRVVANPVTGRGEIVLDFDATGRLMGIELLGQEQLVDVFRAGPGHEV